jgi:hypothetical protein
MKYKHQSLFLGICLIISLVATNASAYAQERLTTAFTSFHIRYPLDSAHNPYNCVIESYGAAVNQCPYEVGLMFDLPIDGSEYDYTIYAQNYVSGTGSTGANCYAWSYDGDGHGTEGTFATFHANGPQTLTFTGRSSAGYTISLLCNVPPGEGISSLGWTL